MMNTDAKLTKFVRAAGCAAKLAPGSLADSTCHIESFHKDLIVGFEGNEDAGVYKINDEIAIVQTVDFITPVVDDPYVYGQIAAANSLSDVFAMGADAKTALNLVGFDSKNHTAEILSEIMRGGQNKVAECGAVIVGGHTIQTPEMIYGLSCTGFIHPNKVLRNNTPKIGDVLILTKPLGMGILITAIKNDLLDPVLAMKVAENLRTLNYKASLIARESNVSACTDVTGFGLMGHMREMSAGNVTMKIDFAKVPYFIEAIEMASKGMIPGGTRANHEYNKPYVYLASSIEFEQEMILFDAQTSGGLLVSIPQSSAQQMIGKCIDAGLTASIIGDVIEYEGYDIVVDYSY